MNDIDELVVRVCEKEEKKVYEPIRFNYNRENKTSSITILLNLPDMNAEEVTINLPFTEEEPALKYQMPPYSFRDDISVHFEQRLHALIQVNSKCRSLPTQTRYAHQCEYDEWIYNANLEDRTGYIVWAAIKQYVKNMNTVVEEID